MALPKVTDNIGKGDSQKAAEYNKPVYAETTDAQGNKTIFWNDDNNAKEVFENYLNTDISKRGNYSISTNLENGKLSVFKDYASISLDKNTGDIKVVAPQYVLDRDEYQQVIKPQLEQLSSAYKQDPNYKFASTEGEEPISVEQWVKSINDEISKESYLDQARNIGRLVQEAKDSGYDDANDKYAQVILYGNNEALSPEANDNTRVIVSDFANFNFFKNAESYDPNTRTISLGDFKNMYNRGELSDETILEMSRQLDRRVGNTVTYDDNGVAHIVKSPATRIGSFEDYATLVAMKKMIDGSNPGVGVVRGTVDQITAGIMGFMDSIVGGTLEIADFIIPGDMGINEAWKERIQDYEEKTRVLNSNALVSEAIGSFAGIAADLAFVSHGGSLLKLATVGNKLKKATTFTKIADDIGKSTEALKVAKTAEEIKDAAQAFNKASKLLKAENVVDGISTILRYGNVTDATELVGKALKAANVARSIANSARGSYRAVNALVSIPEFIVESAISTIMIEPDLLSRISEGDKTGEVVPELLKNLAIDTATFGGLKLAAKGAKKAGETTIGAAVSGNAARVIANLEVKLTDTKNAIKTAMFDATPEDIALRNIREGDTNTKVAKGVAQAGNAIITNAKRQLAETDRIHWVGRSFDEIKELTKPVTEARLQVMRANNAVDSIQRGIRAKMNEAIIDNEKLYNDLSQSMTSVTDIERSLGRIGKRVRGVQNSGMRLFSQETSNYISASNRLAYLDRKGGDKIGKDGFRIGLSSDEKKSYEDAQRQVKLFLDNATPELKQAVDNFSTNLKAAYKQFTDYFLEKGVMSRAEIMSLRETAYWGIDANEYMRTQRAKGSKGVFIAKEKQLTTTTQKLAGGTGDFADPMLVFMDWMARLCDQANRNDAARMLLASSDPTVLASSTKTQATINAAYKKQQAYQKAFRGSFGGVLESLQIKDVFGDVFKAQQGKVQIRKQQGKASKAYGDILKAREKKYLSSKTARAIYISELPKERLDKLSEQLVGYRTPSELIDTMVSQGNTAEDAFQYWLSSVPDNTKKYVERYITQNLEAQGKEATNVLTHANYKAAADVDGLFEQNIMSNMLSSNKEYRDSELVSKAISAEQRNYEVYQKATIYRDERKKLADLQKEFGMTGEEGWAEGELFDRARDSINDALDFVIDSAIKHDNGKTLQAVLDAAETTDELAKEYVAMLSLKKGSKNRKELIDRISNKAEQEFSESIKAYALDKKMPIGSFEKQKNEYVKTIREMVDAEIHTRFSDLHNLMAESKNPVADYDYAFQEINRLKRDIGDYSARADVIGLGVRNGEVEYIKTSPLVAALVKTNVGYTQATGMAMQNIGYFWSKIFRLNTTGLRLKSWLMQLSRDSIAFYSGTGMFRTLANVADGLEDTFGPELVTNMKRFNTELYERSIKQLEKEGKTGEELEKGLERIAVQRELEVGYGRSGSATETSAYQYRRENYGALFGEDQTGGVGVGRFSQMLDNITNKPTIGNSKVPNPFNLNQRREQYMRKSSYANSFYQGMKKGYGIENSKVYAEFIMNNSLTNFSRTTVHLANLQRSVPYLGAAINGTKSFYRMLALDPVGVMGRLIGGVMIPTMAITCISLSDEENRKVYNNIPEYEKADNICIVWNGQLIKIPIPQEMSSIFGVPRMFVEKLYGTGYNSFWELAANNAIGLSPIDLSGFLNLDNKNLFENNPTIWDNIVTGVVKMSAQLMNPALKTGVMLATGTDPYTGKKINTAYECYDADTNESYVMDYYSGEFAKFMGRLFGQETNAWMAQAVMDNLIGKVGNNILNNLVTMGNQISDGGNAGSAIGGAIIGGLGVSEASEAFTGLIYDRAQSAWSHAMKQLQDQKASIVNSKEYQSVNDAITFATSEEAKQRARGKLNDMLQPLYQNALNAVNNLNSRYGAQFTRAKFAAVLSLLNTAKATPLPNLSNYTSAARQEEFYAGRDMAIETMYRMGFTSPNDGSIFGYVKRSGDNVSFVFQEPLAILANEQLGYAQQDIHTANIKSILDAAEIKSSDMWDGYYKQTTKAGKKQYKKDWNSRVVQVLAPYIKEYGVDVVVRNANMGEFLNDYIFVDYGKSAKNYIKSIFKED